MKHIFFLVFLAFYTSLFSQVNLVETHIPNNLKGNQILPIENEKTNQLGVFSLLSQRSVCYLYDENLVLKDSVQTAEIPSKYKSLLGAQVGKNGTYQLFLSSKGQQSVLGVAPRIKYGFAKFDFSTKKTSWNELELDLKKEYVIESFNLNSRFVLMTINAKSSVLNFYRFDDNGISEKIVVDCSDILFRDWDGSKVLLSKLLITKTSLGNSYLEHLVRVNLETQNSIRLTVNSNKLYLEKGRLLISLDINKNFTQILSIDTADWSKKLMGFVKPTVMSSATGYSTKSNSLIYDGKYFGIKLFGNKLKLEVTDFNTKEAIKTYLIENNKPISLKNSPIIIKDGQFVKHREVEKTSQFFKKLRDGNIALSITKDKNENYEITVGASIPIQYVTTTNSTFSNTHFPVHSNGLNPVHFSYTGFIGGRTVYIKCLVDKNFDNLDGNIRANVFEKIRKFVDQENVNYKTVFKFDDKVVLCFYDDSNKVFFQSFEK
ncbi:hypothetical protein [Flagellimonas sp.]|uniref:hypothetical protein n=1 Tax=Flagellimonas sp. TaxID=2058762 RepID=UPI003B530395